MLESCLCSFGLEKRYFNKKILGIVFLSNILGYFLEYLLSKWLNGGHILLVWIPWVRIIGSEDLLNYLISFPLVLITTLLIEISINCFFLKRYFKSKSIVKVTFWANLVSTLILIIVFNCFLFHFINGEEVGQISDIVPLLKKWFQTRLFNPKYKNYIDNYEIQLYHSAFIYLFPFLLQKREPKNLLKPCSKRCHYSWAGVWQKPKRNGGAIWRPVYVCAQKRNKVLLAF